MNAQCAKTPREPERRSPCPPHLRLLPSWLHTSTVNKQTKNSPAFFRPFTITTLELRGLILEEIHRQEYTLKYTTHQKKKMLTFKKYFSNCISVLSK